MTPFTEPDRLTLIGPCKRVKPIEAIALQAVPGIEQLPIVDRLGIAAILVAVIIEHGYLLLTRKVVLGSTCDLLLVNEREKTARAVKEAADAKDDVDRLAKDFNSNLAIVLGELAGLRQELASLREALHGMRRNYG